MSKLRFSVLLAPLAVALFAVQPTVVALQEPSTANPPSASGQQPDSDANATPPASMQSADQQTFMGRIAKSGGKYVLKDSSRKMTYTLDDQSQAKNFEGKNVRVTAMLDAQTNTIRVSAIEPES